MMVQNGKQNTHATNYCLNDEINQYLLGMPMDAIGVDCDIGCFICWFICCYFGVLVSKSGLLVIQQNS